MLETKAVARNTRSCEKVAEQLVEIPNPKATEGFIWKEIASPPGLLERKTTRKTCLLRRFFLMFTLTGIPEEELGRVIESKGDEFRWKKNKKIS